MLERCLDRLIDARNVPVPKIVEEIESDLRPLHVYQTALSCVDRLQKLDDDLGVFAVPTISARPTKYNPRDVYFVVNIMLENVRRIAASEKIDDLPANEIVVSEKTPAHVFGRAVSVYIKLKALCGNRDLSPSEVYAQMVRSVADVKSILRQADPQCRYKIDAEPAPAERKPAAVFQKCLQIRRLINTHRTRLGMELIPVPKPPNYEVRPGDVFFQTQIIIGELNLLKNELHTISSTPLPIPPADEKTPTDVYGQASMLEYLLTQVGEVKSAKAQASREPTKGSK